MTTEHSHWVPSYYAATANWRTGYPSLAGEHDADVCIVGGGFTGINTAIELAERGLSVIVLEAHRVGWGCSGRNGGQVIGGVAEFARLRRHLGDADARVIWRLGIDATDIVWQRIDRFAIDCDMTAGYFDAARNRREMDALRADREQRLALGFRHDLEVIEGKDVRGVLATDAYVGGIYNKYFGHVHPLNLCLGEARGAAKLGVKIFERTKVTMVHAAPQPRVQTSKGVVNAAHVVIAGNAYLNGLIRQLDGLVLPAASYIIATEPLSETLAAEILPRNCAVCDQKSLLDYFRLSPDRRLLFGGRCNYLGREPRNVDGTLLPRLLHIFPQLRGIRVDFRWGGNVAVSLNRIPQIGRLQGRIFYAQGYSGHGVVPTHLAARVLADAITADATVFDIFSRIRPRRLPGGRWLASPMLALAMLYYQLKDRF